MLKNKEEAERVEAALDKIKDGYIEAQQKVSSLRKSTKDTSVVNVMLLEVPAKMRMITITGKEEDIESANQTLISIKKEINEVIAGSDFDRIHAMLIEAFDNLRKGEKKKAREKYNEIMAIYSNLTKCLKETIYPSCEELRKRLK